MIEDQKRKDAQNFWNAVFEKTKFEDLPQEVQNELYDYQGMISTWSKVAHEFSGWSLSKPNYTADVYISHFNEYIQECVRDAEEDFVEEAKLEIENLKIKLGSPKNGEPIAIEFHNKAIDKVLSLERFRVENDTEDETSTIL